ncbi:hypothetical protein GCM10027515_17770 [Schumannella luteola]|uniref:DUF1905 domain-containing protein n=1 Tax=Schumannella luteola TaxID=472059 RepID=A0A852YT04_9MICO|nr:DUF1905 domain-containing protein [Schumannella luteola]NYH00426.1 hypothetical protein [Schumannella luteola]TPX03662.1 DUF1905 domain-containing protein [Schumannella luteola]
MTPKLEHPIDLDVAFEAPIGVDVKGELWSCVEIPGSAELFGTQRGVRVDVAIDGIELANVGAMVTGRGGHMVSISAKLRAKLGKDLGDTVAVRLTRRYS